VDVRITRARRIYADGRHNAFTGMAAAFGQAWISFRSARSHMSLDGAVRILASSDGVAWRTAAFREDSAGDLRDPKMAVLGGRLLAYFARRPETGPRTMWRMESVDGIGFGETKPVRGIPEGHWLWHVRERGGELYGTVYRRVNGVHLVALYGSADGEEWEWRMDFPVPGNETWLDFGADGTLWALVRDDLFGCVPTLCSASPPYKTLDSVRRLPMRLQGPMLKRLEGGCVVVARQWDDPGWRRLRTDVIWVGDGEAPQTICTLPSGGDTSYADWLDMGPGRAVVSYYSSHEHEMDLPHSPGAAAAADAPSSPPEPPRVQPADVYLADVSYA
jgi:hypothetical protein